MHSGARRLAAERVRGSACSVQLTGKAWAGGEPCLPVRPRRCMAFSATTVSAGQGLGVVVATGDNAQIGQINKLVSQVGTRAGGGPWSAQTRADGLT